MAKVMIVDDSPTEVHVLQTMLTKNGHEVVVATSGEEGVDVRGGALSCVVIDKLPFASPGDPVMQARIDAIRNKGGQPFMEYQVPQAVIALKQGVGRLIRDVNDHGVVVIGDPRLTSKAYGRVFLNSLPAMKQTTDINEIIRFYENTVDFDPSSETFELTEEGESDFFLAQYSTPCITNYQEAFICSGNTYIFPDSSTSDTSMVFTMSFNNEESCDSLLVINLLVDDSYYSATIENICMGESFIFPDGTFTDSNLVHISSYTSAYGCDSLIEIEVIVSPNHLLSEERAICEGEDSQIQISASAFPA